MTKPISDEKPDEQRERAIERALERGESRLTSWTRDGTLITPQELAQAWDQDLQTLRTAVQRGDLFEVWVDETPYCASVFAALGVEATAKVSQALGTQSASAKLVFLLREHGALNGKTVLKALESGTSMGLIEGLARADAAGF